MGRCVIAERYPFPLLQVLVCCSAVSLSRKFQARSHSQAAQPTMPALATSSCLLFIVLPVLQLVESVECLNFWSQLATSDYLNSSSARRPRSQLGRFRVADTMTSDCGMPMPIVLAFTFGLISVSMIYTYILIYLRIDFDIC